MDDFQIFEDGREQEISFFSQNERSPISIGVLIDISGSQQDKLQQALQTVREIATTLSGDDEMFIITFNSVAKFRQKFTSDPQQILRSLEDLKSNGETAVHDAIELGLREIQTASNQKKILLLITDGFDTKSKITAVETEQSLKESEVLTYAIGIDINPNVRKRVRYATYYYMLNKWAAATGGRVIRLVAGESSAAATLLNFCSKSYATNTRSPITRRCHQKTRAGETSKCDSRDPVRECVIERNTSPRRRPMPQVITPPTRTAQDDGDTRGRSPN